MQALKVILPFKYHSISNT